MFWSSKKPPDLSGISPEPGGPIAGDDTDGVRTLRLSGAWTTRTVGVLDAELLRREWRNHISRLDLDLSGITQMDTAGAWLVERLLRACSENGVEVNVTGRSQSVATLMTAVQEASERNAEASRLGRRIDFLAPLEVVGRGVFRIGRNFMMAMDILGATIRGPQMKAGRKHPVNFTAIIHQMDRMGVGAIPVVVLMSFIVGAIVAQQGAFELRTFGAEILVVDLVGILVLREMGVLLTAIMIAGRSGSSITAELGSMKMREEVDALTVIGLNPVGVLVFPRLVALVIVLPCLTVIADFAAIAGAMVVAWVYSGIPPGAFLARMHEAIYVSTIAVGLIKAPFMALIIGVIASVEGMNVGGSAESLGRHVTSSVVKSIFVVIVVDGLFAMFYAAINF